MRLNLEESSATAKAVALESGPSVRLLLFGSRLDDARAGGDIDLFIDDVSLTAAEVVARRVAMRVRLADGLGERKTDIVVQRSDRADLPIHRHARQSGVALCAWRGRQRRFRLGSRRSGRGPNSSRPASRGDGALCTASGRAPKSAAKAARQPRRRVAGTP